MASTPSTEWVELSRSADLIQGAVGDVHVLLWIGKVHLDAVSETRRAASYMKLRHPSGYLALNVIRPNLAMPDGDTRRLAAQVTKETEADLRATAVVVPGRGFWASAARSAMTAIHVLHPVNFPRELFSELDDGCRFLGREAARDGAWSTGLVHAVAPVLAS